jgi:tetratricopeptide (TPR) repeat protein
MYPLYLLLFIFLFLPASWTFITKKNAVIKSAATNYHEGKYQEAIENHLQLITDFELNTSSVNFNLALSYQNNNQLEEAQKTYQALVAAENPMVASFASNQNGVIFGRQQKYEEALLAFKIALIKNPNNEPARYNYELLSRWLENNKDQEQDQEGEGENKEDQQDQQSQQDQKDQQKQSEESKDGKGEEKTQEDKASKSEKKDDKSGEKSQQEKDSEEASDLESDLSDRQKAQEKMREKLQNMNLSPEQASQILDAMNAAEMRYIQQNRKRPMKKPNKGLPDW